MTIKSSPSSSSHSSLSTSSSSSSSFSSATSLSVLHQELARKELEREREMSLDSEEMLTDPDPEPEPHNVVSHSHGAQPSLATSPVNNTHCSHHHDHDCSSSQDCLPSSTEPAHVHASAPAGLPGSPQPPASPERQSTEQAHASEPLPWNGTRKQK